jgi:hypothetical protein
MQLLVTTGLIAIAVAFMQKINFSGQYYDSDQKNYIRNVMFALPLALSIAIIGLAAMEGESRRIMLGGKLVCLATASLILMLAVSPLLVKAGYSRPMLFAWTIVPLGVCAFGSIFCLYRFWALALFVVFATSCLIEYASYQTLRPAGSLGWHDIAAWAYAVPVVLWLTVTGRSVAVRSISTIRGAFALAPMALFLATLLSEWLYEFFWMRTS